MRRVITTLAILLVVIVAGLTALVALVNPNDFRAYMVRQVEQRSGYHLALSGDLRWHVWPKLSILAGRMSLTAPGAAQPLVSAENMRLDVDLWPLLSHQLSVSQVMLRNAVIRSTPDSAARLPKDAPVAPARSDVNGAGRGWSFNISQLSIVDSLLIWQPRDGAEYNFRNFNLRLNQDQFHQASVELSTSLTRNQRNATLSLRGELDAGHYPQRMTGSIEQLNYSLSGANIPPQGVQGTLSAQASWLADRQQFSLANLKLTANDSVLSGTVNGQLASPQQQLVLQLHASQLNFDNLMSAPPVRSDSNTPAVTVPRAPVIATPRVQNNEDSPLNQLDLAVRLTADSSVWRGLQLHDFSLDMNGQQGVMTLNNLSGMLEEGKFSVPGTIDLSQPVTQVVLRPALDNIEVSSLLSALEMPPTLQGKISLQSELSGEGLTLAAAQRQWHGQAQIHASSIRLAQIDLNQMVRRAVQHASNRVSSDESRDPTIHQLNGKLLLDAGKLHFTGLRGEGDRLQLLSHGAIDIPRRQLDVAFDLTMSGWKGDERLVALLSQQHIPLRIYGKWSNPEYSLPVDDLLRQQLQNETKSRVNEWLDRQSRKEHADAPSKAGHP